VSSPPNKDIPNPGVRLQMCQNIKTIVDEGLCTGCGTCAGICPLKAIRMTINDEGLYIPTVTARCTLCGCCLLACPGHAVDFRELNTVIFGKEPENPLIGNFIDCYVGHANETDMRLNASSGGLVTSLLVFALEEGIIDGALVTKMKESKPTEPEAFVARTVDQITSARASKYCPVPANIALQEIVKTPGKYAAVGLPCHIQGIRKAEAINEDLRKRIVLHLGLFCSKTISFKGTEFLLKQMGIRKDEVRELSYRGRGWPGTMTIRLRSDTTKEIPFNSYREGLFNLFFFVAQRCLMCVDMTSELADASFGDAWLPEFSNDQLGSSLVIVRNSMIDELLQYAVAKGKMTLNRISCSRVLEQHANRVTMRYKKAAKARFLPFAMLRRQTPRYSTSFSRSKLRDYFVSTQSYVNMYISMNQELQNAIPAMSALTRFAERVFRG
jgi:coenzyme F420 hydrogenase subunit beta